MKARTALPASVSGNGRRMPIGTAKRKGDYPFPANPTLATALAVTLGETAPEPLELLARVVRVCGPEVARNTLQATLDTERQGGMLRRDGERRTPGGVFFQLLKGRVTPAQRARLWPPMSPYGPAPTWANHAEIVEEALTARGEANVKIVLAGRPGKIVRRGAAVAVAMESKKSPSLPKGLPTPPPTPTTYLAYITGKQWAKVESALNDPADVLIIKGFPQLDVVNQTIVVYASETTTKLLEAAKKDSAPASFKGNPKEH